ncbi:DUF3618 domain-containing protein [Micromonospora sp. NPDC049559]|uniref:DUF3618 domain-containing protein n=1 Tax=Micromonospora sp. NPDC049559 TaxID=3155923 RepID=UPI0034169B99
MTRRSVSSQMAGKRQEIERTRAELGDTVRVLAARFDLKARARARVARLRADCRARVARLGTRGRATVRRTGEAARAGARSAGTGLRSVSAGARRHPAVTVGSAAAAAVLTGLTLELARRRSGSPARARPGRVRSSRPTTWVLWRRG